MSVKVVIFKGRDKISWPIRKRAQWMFSIPYDKTYSHIGVAINDILYEATPSKGVTDSRRLSQLTDEVDIYDISKRITKKMEKELIEEYTKELGKGYDFIGILGFLYIFKPIENKRRWFCSELAINKLRKVLNEPILRLVSDFKTSPTMLAISTELVYISSMNVKEK